MYDLQRMLSWVRDEVIRTMRAHHQPPRLGLVSSYNPKLHAVKVQFQPVGTESGWIPLASVAIGNQFGHLHAPNIKDQVMVHFQEGDHGTGMVALRLFSTIDQPPQIQTGEHLYLHPTGSGIYHQQDGTVSHFGPGYIVPNSQLQQGYPGQTGGGTSGDTSTGGQNGTTQTTPSSSQPQPKGGQLHQYQPNGNATYTIPNGSYTSTVKQAITHISQESDIVHTAQNNITNSAQNGTYSRSAGQSISDSAPAISHDGPTTVSSTLGVSNVTTALAYNMSSDVRAKENIAPLPDNLFDLAMALQLYEFDLYEAEINPDGSVTRKGQPIRRMGALAQEAQKVFPQIVSGEWSKDILRIDPSFYGVIALKALQQYVAKTDAEIAELKQEIARLRSI